MSDKADLYRLFDDAGALLYVGVSKSTIHRLAQHSSTTWWPAVAAVSVQHFANRDQALAAESAAIKAEAPAHNVRQVPRPVSVQMIYTVTSRGQRAALRAAGFVNTPFSRGLGRLIRERRDAKGFGQVEVAAKFGVTQSTVSKWERGRAIPDLHTFIGLADLLEITVDDVKAAA